MGFRRIRGACRGRPVRIPREPMQTRPLGRTDIQLSEVALGTWGLASGSYGPVPREQFVATVREALDRGVSTFDLAPLWGDGEGERIVAEALGEQSKDAVLITRAGISLEGGKVVERFDSESLIASVEASLGRLRRDRVDLLMLHDPPQRVLQGDSWHAGVEQLVQTGKVRAWGASVGTTDEARLALKLGASAVGVVHNLLEPHALYDLSPSLKDFGAGLIARSPLGYGLLAGRWPKEHTFAKDDHRTRRWDAAALGLRYDQLEGLRFLVHDGVPDLASAAMRFVLSSPFVTSMCVGARTPEQIAHAATASVGAPYLPPTDMGRLKPLIAAH